MPAFDEEAQELAYAEALADGEFAKAALIRKEINAHLVTVAENNIVARTTEQSARKSLEAVANQAVTDYPYLNDDAETMALIVADRDRRITEGTAPADALKAAVDRIAPRFAPASAAPPHAPHTPTKELPAGSPAVDTRTQQALARGAADSNLQPANVQGSGQGNRTTAGQLPVEELTEAQFEALSHEEKKRLRGDA